MVRPTSKSLLDAAKLIEDEAAAEKVRLDAVTVANNAEAAKKTIEAKTDAALLNAGVGVAAGATKKGVTKAAGNGGGGSSNGGNNSGNGGGNGNLFAGNHFAWLLAAFLLLLTALIFVLALVKADKSQVDHLDGKVQAVGAKADDALALAAKNKTRIEVVNGDVEKAALVASMANDKAEKALNKPACSDSCSKREYVYPKKQNSIASKPVRKPRPQKPVTPAPVSVGKAVPECTDCKPTPEFVPRKQIANAEGICGIVVEDAKTQNVVAKLMLQPYSGEKDMSRKGNLQIMQVAEFKLGEVSRIEGAVTGVKHTDCLEAIKYVKSQWPKVVKNFKLPDDCLPVRYGS